MKVTYDGKTDTLTMVLKENVPVVDSDEQTEGLVLDFDAKGEVVSIEVLDASRRVTEAHRVDFRTAE
jgi:uncharacterized protein YuzE